MLEMRISSVMHIDGEGHALILAAAVVVELKCIRSFLSHVNIEDSLVLLDVVIQGLAAGALNYEIDFLLFSRLNLEHPSNCGAESDFLEHHLLLARR